MFFHIFRKKYYAFCVTHFAKKFFHILRNRYFYGVKGVWKGLPPLMIIIERKLLQFQNLAETSNRDGVCPSA